MKLRLFSTQVEVEVEGVHGVTVIIGLLLASALLVLA